MALNDKAKAKIEKLKGKRKPLKEKEETFEMKNAFEVYYMMGKNRSLNKTAKETGCSTTSVKRWASTFNWQQRILDRDNELAEKLRERNDNLLVNSKAFYRSAIYKLTQRFIEDVEAGRIRIKGIKDFEMIARLDLDLMGENTDDQMVDNVASLVEALGRSGFNDVPDPDKEDNNNGKE